LGGRNGSGCGHHNEQSFKGRQAPEIFLLEVPVKS